MPQVLRMRSPWRSWPNRKDRKQDRTKPCGWLRLEPHLPRPSLARAAHPTRPPLVLPRFHCLPAKLPEGWMQDRVWDSTPPIDLSRHPIRPAATRAVRRVDDGLPPSPPPDAWDLRRSRLRPRTRRVQRPMQHPLPQKPRQTQWLPPPLLPLP